MVSLLCNSKARRMVGPLLRTQETPKSDLSFCLLRPSCKPDLITEWLTTSRRTWRIIFSYCPLLGQTGGTSCELLQGRNARQILLGCNKAGAQPPFRSEREKGAEGLVAQEIRQGRPLGSLLSGSPPRCHVLHLLTRVKK